ncbi:MAG: hypothetical protein PHR29_05360 [Acholeplasmataceae bacterium]|nr:hypothetical protein [Acholeplasmataceae bacterium]
MKKSNKLIFVLIIMTGLIVFLISLVLLYAGDELDQLFNVIGIRVVALFLSFVSFLSSILFSLLILLHNKTTVKINDDTNKRAELFRELSFASSNYSIIDFIDRMLLYNESERYIERFIEKKSSTFHVFEDGIDVKDVFNNPNQYSFISMKIPFRVVEGKMVSMITFDKLRFERDERDYIFYSENKEEARAFILYNERTKRNNMIINLVMPKESKFYNSAEINRYSKIKIYINIYSLLGVKIKGNSELYFTNPKQIEGDNTNTYAINSSNFLITEGPKITMHNE